ncbi:hypothetical protein EON62_03015, partial [archaeon]
MAPLPPAARRWTTWLNVDIPSALTPADENDIIPELRSSVYGYVDGYAWVALAWALIPPAAALVFWLLLAYGYMRYWDMHKLRQGGKDVIVILLTLLQLPAVLALSRMYLCNSHATLPGWRLAVDPALKCFEANHMILAAVCFPSTLFFAIGLPLWMARRIHRTVVYRRRFEHERYVRWKEAEYVHHLSDDWRRDQMWLSSSFVARWGHTYDRPAWMVCNTLLVVVYTYGRSMPDIQADIFFAIIGLWSIRQLLVPGFRCGTSNLLASCIYSGLGVIVFWGVMRAHRIVNSMTVDSAWSRTMNHMNIALIVIVLAVVALSCVPLFGWPQGYVGPKLWREMLLQEGMTGTHGRAPTRHEEAAADAMQSLPASM